MRNQPSYASHRNTTGGETPMSELRQEAEAMAEQFSDHLEVDPAEIESRLENLVDEYRVPLEEARRSVTNSYLDDAGLDRDELAPGGATRVQVADIDEDEQWVDLRVTLVDLWEPRSDSIAQVGLLGDESGTIKFVAFETSDLPALSEGQSYALSNVVTDEYEGRYSVKLNRTTQITELDESIEVGDDADTVEGALVDIQSGSGLIKRCPEDDCTRVLQNGRCSEHGQVDGEFDLRIKGVLDDGETVTEVIFDREATERLTGTTLEEAKDLAMDALDTTVVAEEMADDVLGRYYRVTGPTFGRYVLVDEFEEPGPVDVESALIEARSI
jgi:replication factor A1